MAVWFIFTPESAKCSCYFRTLHCLKKEGGGKKHLQVKAELRRCRFLKDNLVELYLQFVGNTERGRGLICQPNGVGHAHSLSASHQILATVQ